MVFDSVQARRSDGCWGTLSALVASEGTIGHRFAGRLMSGVASLRDLADAMHMICMLHGRHPGVIDHAGAHNRVEPATDWLHEAGEHFSRERAYLIRIVAAAGPLPSTPGQAESEGAVVAQRHALDMLAQSDRTGCAMGAALALSMDWAAIRQVLDAAAHRLGIAVPEHLGPSVRETAVVVETLARQLPVERAMLFGAQQLLAQHRGLWDLLEARASARESY